MKQLRSLHLCVEKSLSNNDSKLVKETFIIAPGVQNGLGTYPGNTNNQFEQNPLNIKSLGTENKLISPIGTQYEYDLLIDKKSVQKRGDIDYLDVRNYPLNNYDQLLFNFEYNNYLIESKDWTTQVKEQVKNELDFYNVPPPPQLIDGNSFLGSKPPSIIEPIINELGRSINNNTFISSQIDDTDFNNVIFNIFDQDNNSSYNVGSFDFPQGSNPVFSVPLQPSITDTQGNATSIQNVNDIYKDIYNQDLDEEQQLEYEKRISGLFEDEEKKEEEEEEEEEEKKKELKEDFDGWNILQEKKLSKLFDLTCDYNQLAKHMHYCPCYIKKKLEKMGLYSIENFENDSNSTNKNRNIMINRIQQFIDDGILKLSDPNRGIVESIIKRKFYIKKATVSFQNENMAEWSSLTSLENTYDVNGNLMKIDPIEYEIRKLSPIEAVKKVIRERIEPFINLKFEFLDEKENFSLLDTGVIRINFDPNKGSWSLIGIDHYFSRDDTTMNLGWLDSATIMHEFGHFIGLVHEHQIPFGKPIEWDKPVVYKWAKATQGWDKKTTDNNIIKKYSKNQINGIKYDPTSIMLYFFPKELTLDNKGSNQNLRLSFADAKYFMSVMPGKKLDLSKFYYKIYNVDIYKTRKIILISFLTIISISIISYILFKYLRKRK